MGKKTSGNPISLNNQFILVFKPTDHKSASDAFNVFSTFQPFSSLQLRNPLLVSKKKKHLWIYFTL